MSLSFSKELKTSRSMLVLILRFSLTVCPNVSISLTVFDLFLSVLIAVPVKIII